MRNGVGLGFYGIVGIFFFLKKIGCRGWRRINLDLQMCRREREKSRFGERQDTS